MDQERAGASVGVLNPGGNPQRLADGAQGWQELSTQLRQQSDRLTKLLSQSEQVWHGEGADAFHARGQRLAATTAQAAQVASEVGAQQRKHAEHHSLVLELIKEILIQIAVTLALMALATIFPWLLAAAQVQLAMLVVTGCRIIQTLVRSLSLLIKTLVRARTWLEQLGKLAWKGKNFSVGYGRIIADGARDFATDLVATTTTMAIQHKKLDPGQIFLSAGLSAGVGGAVGGLEASGMKYARTADGAIKRDAAGKPEFVTFGDQLKKKINGIGAKPQQATAAAVPAGPSHSRAVFDRLSQAQPAAREHGLTGALPEGERLTRRVSQAGQRHEAAVARLADAESAHRQANELLSQSRDTLHRRAADLRQAKADEHAALSALSDLYHASGSKSPSRESEQYQALQARRAAATRNYEAAADRLADAERDHLRTVRNQRAGEQAVRQAADAAAESRRDLEQAQARVAAWYELAAAREAVLRETSGADRLRNAWQNNDWRQGFGSPKTWREVAFYDTVKDGSKGATGAAAQAGVGVAQGNSDPSDIWKDALLGAAGGSVRGVVNGRTGNVLYPRGGIEEILWKSGTKSLDKYVRGKIKTEVSGPTKTDSPPDTGSQQDGRTGERTHSGS